MQDWASGYVSDLTYTYGYYNELNPFRLRLAFLSAGIVFPEVMTACELGYGQGLSANIHAAATPTRWVGTDFNPSQASYAIQLADETHSGAELFDESFLEFSNRNDLPDFDYIGLHGIWSWISDENRAVIVDFIKRKLKVGGVVYVSYNTLPGWGAFAPIRHLMTQHADVIGSSGLGLINRIGGAIDFATQLMDTNPIYSRANPLVAERLKKLKEQDKHYLAHEYFNRDWHPMHFSQMADWLEPAKLQYACSANFLDHIDAINLTAEQQAFLQAVPDRMFKQSVRDFIVNQQFRKDYWVKGLRSLSPLKQIELLRNERLVLVTPVNDINFKVTTDVGEVALSEQIYKPVIDLLSDHKIYSIKQLESGLKEKHINFGQLLQALTVLSGLGFVASAQDDASINKSRKSSDALNLHLINSARDSSDVSYLASDLIQKLLSSACMYFECPPAKSSD